jgi:hypothetical protein
MLEPGRHADKEETNSWRSQFPDSCRRREAQKDADRLSGLASVRPIRRQSDVGGRSILALLTSSVGNPPTKEPSPPFARRATHCFCCHARRTLFWYLSLLLFGPSRLGPEWLCHTGLRPQSLRADPSHDGSAGDHVLVPSRNVPSTPPHSFVYHTAAHKLAKWLPSLLLRGLPRDRPFKARTTQALPPPFAIPTSSRRAHALGTQCSSLPPRSFS